MPQPSTIYRRHRFPGELISHAVWLYYRFLLIHRDVEEMLSERGVLVSYETIRRWCHKFGQTYADGLWWRCAPPGDKWPIDEVQLKIKGRKHWLWRAVDQNGGCSISWCRSVGTRQRPKPSCVVWLRGAPISHGWSSRTSWPATGPPCSGCSRGPRIGATSG